MNAAHLVRLGLARLRAALHPVPAAGPERPDGPLVREPAGEAGDHPRLDAEERGPAAETASFPVVRVYGRRGAVIASSQGERLVSSTTGQVLELAPGTWRVIDDHTYHLLAARAAGNQLAMDAASLDTKERRN